MSECGGIRRGLTTLPLELLVAICSHLCDHCVRKHTSNAWPIDADSDLPLNDQMALPLENTRLASLLNLSRTCKMLRAVAEPLLYHSPSTSREEDVWFLVDTLLKRPDLALKVAQIDIGYPTQVPSTATAPRSRRTIPPRVQDEVERLRKMRATNLGTSEVAQDTRGSLPDGTEISAEVGEYAALHFMLLQLVPNLEAGRFFIPNEPFSTSDMDLISHNHNLSLKSLRKLAFRGIINRGFLLDRATPIMRLAPNLEVLYFENCTAVTNLFSASLGRDSPTDPPPLSKLTELSLADSRLAVGALAALLDAVGPRLSKFSIQRTAPILDFDQVLTVLQPWKSTLKELSIITSQKTPSGPAGLVSGVFLLREFHALETLCAEAEDLKLLEYLGHDSTIPSPFPSSLRSLRLRGNSRQVAAIASSPLVAAIVKT